MQGADVCYGSVSADCRHGAFVTVAEGGGLAFVESFGEIFALLECNLCHLRETSRILGGYL